MIEPTYTGKALFAMHDLLNKNVFSPRERILFVHTGGLTGLLGMLGRFDF
jgi:1-aminocyclopropane-1-carboxylate deaminase